MSLPNTHPTWSGKHPDYIVLRVETEKEIPGVSSVEGEWLDRAKMPFLEEVSRELFGVNIEPTMDLEVALDGSVAQVWKVTDL